MRKIKINKIINKIMTESKEVRKINLAERHDLKSIPEVIEKCKNLEELDISFTSIASIPDFVFQLPKLKKISYLGCSDLVSQPSGLKYAKNLESISLYISTGQRIPEDIYSLNKFKSLTVQGDIVEWGEKIGEIKAIEELISFDTKIKDLPESIERLSKLKRISFWQPLFSETDPVVNLKLNSIFEKLSKCNYLKTLELDRNGIVEIPKSIKHLKGLERFSAKDNKLISFPIELYELFKLKELDLGTNQLIKIPKGIGSLVNLKIIKFNSNWINQLNTDYLFADIDKFENLEVLELWSCQSKISIPDTISNLKKLKILDLDNNQVFALSETINSMKRLKKFRYSYLASL